jgi:hypothetical protein
VKQADDSRLLVVYQIRQALDDEDHQIIKTVYGFGFSFAAQSSSEDRPASQCILTIGDEDFLLQDGENIIGREWDAAVRIDAASSRDSYHEDIDGLLSFGPIARSAASGVSSFLS